MTTPNPQALVAIESALGYALTQEWAGPMAKIVPELLDLISTGQWASARVLIDTFHLQNAVTNAREQVEELAISALLFGASQAAGSVANTSYVAEEKAIPEALSQAISQLDISLKYTAAEEIRWALHLMVNEAEEAEKNKLFKEDDGHEKSLYVYRSVVNSADIWAWMKAQGFPSMLDQSDLHVTCCFSKEPLDWTQAPRADELLTVSAGPRSIEVFGSAVVLTIDSPVLQARHKAFRDAGASYDFDEYRPHVTLTYDAGDVDLSKIEPYRGALEFGPEVFQEINLKWKDSVEETSLQKAETMTLAQRLNAAVLDGKALIDINANLTTSRLISFGFLSEAAAKNITTYQVNEVLDDRTCPICQMMHGKTFEVVTEYSKLVTALGTTDPTELKNLAPWPSQSKASVSLLASKSNADLQGQGLGSPPYHPLCRGYLVTVGTVTEDTPMLGIKPPVDMSWVYAVDVIGDNVPTATFKMMKRSNMSRDDFIKSVLGPDEFDRVVVRILKNGKLKMYGMDGKTISHIERIFDVENNRVDHALLQVHAETQGRSVVKGILSNAMKLYKQIGIEAVDVHANIDVGGYAWAKYGFVPLDYVWLELRQDILKVLDTIDMPDTERVVYMRLLASEDPKSIWALSDTVHGKKLLLKSDWFGELNMSDPEAVQRFENYVGK